MERRIKITQFRNIGLDEAQSIVLNNDYSKGKSGNLIVVIGSNNSGKSNVLDAISKIKPGNNIIERDQTTLTYDNTFRHPSVSLCYKDEKYHVEFTKGLNCDGTWNVISGDFGIIAPSRTQIKEDIAKIKSEIARYGRTFDFLDEFLVSLNNETNKEEDVVRMIPELFKNIQNTINRAFGMHVWNSIKNLGTPTVRYYLEIVGSQAERIKKEIESATDLPALPSIHIYEEKKLNGHDLIVSNVNNIQNSSFFKSLFNILKINPDEILNAYKHYNSYPNSAILNKLERDFDQKLVKLNDQFNKMYHVSNDKYKFTLDFHPNQISFGIARGKDGDGITLEYQSTGFRWFFNLFFNFLSTNVLKAGDIVIMDEPATNLHPEGQKELRRFIKDFAIRNDILFVIATQSPFLVDPDYYEELRLVSMDNNRSRIINNFTAVNLDDPDSLVAIKNALTIQQNVLYDIDTDVVWIEGITDYIYLTFFKNELGFTNIAFIPFNGVGNNKEQTKRILSKLVKIKFAKRGLLVDGDKAGIDMLEQAKNTDLGGRTHTISELEIDGKHPMMIEDLFSKEDKKKFTFINEKNSRLASELKGHVSLKDFSEETVKNFKQLFELLLDQ